MFKLGSVILSNVLKDVSSAQEAAFICTEKNTSLIQEGGLKKGQKYNFTNLFI